MKTIEERATEYAYNLRYGYYTAEEAYIIGAKEQREIDIDKACEWITEHIDIPYEGEFIDGSPIASDYIEWSEKRLEYAKTIVDAFKQAMEE